MIMINQPDDAIFEDDDRNEDIEGMLGESIASFK